MMAMEDGFGLGEQQGETPPPMDESWWAAVLKDEKKLPDAGETPVSHASSERSERNGDPEDWAWACDLYDCDDTVDLKVIGYNRGGLLVEARTLRGFIPISHLIALEIAEDEETRNQQLASLVDKELTLKVIEFDPERGRLVFSERAALAGPGKRVELLENLKPGDRVEGVVTNITRFGVFVDLGGVEGLIHVSELSWGRVRHPADVIDCGEELNVQVINVDRDKGRVALSLKELLPDPWETVGNRFKVGDVVEGLVTNVVKFGAFVGIEDGLEGLIHVSELGDGNFLHPRNVLEEGENVRVRIINIDPAERRLGLSLRQVPQHEAGEEYQVPSQEQPEAFSY
ncbi:MAG: S1 RNA-binding domain-containing protein [Anaerolineales bacterium]|jgi:small subunit ribosomal protein S1